MSFGFDAPSDMSSDSVSPEMPGVYLCKCSSVKVGENLRGEPAADSMIVKGVIVGANKATESQMGKEVTILARKPNLQDKNPDWHKKRLFAIGIALGQCHPSQIGSGAINLDPDAMLGRHFVVNTAWDEYKGKRTVKVNFNDIWHPDDGKASGDHLTAAVMSTIPSGERVDPAEFQKMYRDPHVPAKGGNSSAGGEKQAGMFDDF